MTRWSAKARRAYYDENYRNVAKREPAGMQVHIPDDIEVREHSAPCWWCGAREGCSHRA